MCKLALLQVVQKKLGRLELIKRSASSFLFGYSCVVSAVLICMHVFYKTATNPCHHYESKELAIAFSPLWLDALISTGMKYLSADAAISPTGMLAQCVLAGFAGALLTKSESFLSSVLCPSVATASNPWQDVPILSILIAPPGASQPLSPSDRAWLIAAAAASAAALLVHRLLSPRLDRLGHLPAAAATAAAWAAALWRLAGGGGDDAYYAGLAGSFIAPALAEALNPADADPAPRRHYPPTPCAAALAAAHAALNSADRLYLAFAWDPAAPPVPQLRAALTAAALKAAALLAVAACLRVRLARALDLPLAAPNARLLDKSRRAGAAGPAAQGGVVVQDGGASITLELVHIRPA
jgi:hypothetical protein